MKAACSRLFEVEALRDGRLSGAELARFQSHLGVCAVCAREARALQVLADALRSPTNLADADELHVRRERTRLLAAFDASLMPTPRSSRTKLWLAAAVAVLSTLAAFVLVLSPARPNPPSATLVPAPDPITIRADSSARWSRQTEAGLEKVMLESGVLSIRVDHAVPSRRLLVLLPDGELEDIGTTFSVSADAGHTARVSVQSGSVVLRLHDAAPLALGAGDAWTAAPKVQVTPETPAVAGLPSTPAHAAAPAPHSAKPAPSATAAPSLDAPGPDPSSDFRAAMSAFNAGDNPRAASLFASFLSQHPQGPRAEDAAYLRILALQRSGNSSATHQAARDYLSRYPHGFRRAEVEALTR